MFKVGDWVRCVKQTGPLVNGFMYLVDDIGDIYIYLRGEDGCGYLPERFVLVEPHETKPQNVGIHWEDENTPLPPFGSISSSGIPGKGYIGPGTAIYSGKSSIPGMQNHTCSHSPGMTPIDGKTICKLCGENLGEAWER